MLRTEGLLLKDWQIRFTTTPSLSRHIWLQTGFQKYVNLFDLVLCKNFFIIIVYYRNYNLHLRNSRMWFVKPIVLNYFFLYCRWMSPKLEWAALMDQMDPLRSMFLMPLRTMSSWWSESWTCLKTPDNCNGSEAIKSFHWRMLDGCRNSVKWYPVTQIVFGSCRSIFDFEAIKGLLANPNFSFWYAIPYWTYRSFVCCAKLTLGFIFLSWLLVWKWRLIFCTWLFGPTAMMHFMESLVSMQRRFLWRNWEQKKAHFLTAHHW